MDRVIDRQMAGWMRRQASRVLVVAAVTVMATLRISPAAGAPPAASGIPDRIAVIDVNGKTVRPLRPGGQKATVLLFVAHDCPISNAYAPELNRTIAAYTARKVAFYLVYVAPGLSPSTVRKHVADYGYRCPALLDPAQKLAKAAGVTITPEAAVYGATGKRLYRGRIDDRYIDFGKARYQATTHDLRAALDAVLEGRAIARPVTKAVGCFIPNP